MRQKTETMLCITFMELLQKCPFSKITIQKLTGKCGVNRQTFYYHFDNIYDLMAKAFEYALVHEGHIYEEMSFACAMRCLLYWAQDNRVILKNVLANAELSYLKRALYPLVTKILSEKVFSSEGFSSSLDGDPEQWAFAVDFLTIGITQYILEWAAGDFKTPVEEIVERLSWLMERMLKA